MRPTIIAAALAASLCTACASTGTKFSPDAIASLQPGATVADVQAALGGPPNATATRADGSRVLVWLHGHADALGSSGAESASLLFDSSGRFVRVLTQSNVQNR